MKTKTFKNAHLFDPSLNLNTQGSVVVEGDLIIDVIKGKNADSGEVIDLHGALLTPGFIDISCQLGEPGFEQKESIQSGSHAAAAGGFTTVCMSPQTNPVNDSGFVTQYIQEKINTTAVIKVHPIGAISEKLNGQNMAAIDSMIKAGCVALSDGNKTVMNAYLLRKTLEYLKTYDVPVVEHCEDVNLVGLGVMNEGEVSSQIGLRGIPNAAEDVIVSRDISLCAHTNSKLHLNNLSSHGAIEVLAHAKARGLPVTASVTAQHLLLTEENLKFYDTAFKLSPPLRAEKDRTHLVSALQSGVIDCLTSGHTPHSEEDKDIEFELALSGASSLETTFSSTYSIVEKRELSLERLVESLTLSPAKIFKFSDRGQLKKSMKADLTAINLNLAWQVDTNKFFSKSKYSPFNGAKFNAKVVATFVNGVKVFDVEKGILE
ncbi:MAG: dihydroorotase [Oligoflexia bacterium]|nr:dihydroorotase [Oligoflexia bacterium]